MKRGLALVLGALISCVASAQMPKLDDIMKGAGSLPKAPAVGSSVGTGDAKTDTAGIKEALAVGTERAVNSLSRVDGYFGDAIRDMTLDDVRGILTGGDTAATDFFNRKTRDKLYAAFKPVVSQKVDEVGATRAYKNMMGRYESVPMMGKQSLDLDDYVTNKSLDGLFHMVGEEEKKIRTNPAARTTDLLKTVFGK